jgi:hypothetical protein
MTYDIYLENINSKRVVSVSV